MDEENNNATEEQGTVDETTKGQESQEVDNTGDNKSVDGDETVEKLQKRLGSKTAENHDLSEQLKSAQSLIEDLKSGKKSIKQLAEEDKQSEQETEKDKVIENLKAELTHNKALNETNAVFKEQGLVVSDEVLSMVVGSGTDNDSIFSNVKALTDLINTTKEETRKEFLKGRTPGATSSTVQSEGASVAEQRNKQAVVTNDPWKRK